jgi:hypothetical protein
MNAAGVMLWGENSRPAPDGKILSFACLSPHGGCLHRGPARRFSGCGGNLTAETLRTAETAVLFSADSAVLCASAVDLVAIHIDSTHLLKVAQNIINQWFVNLQKSAVRPVRAIGFTIATP